MSLQQFLLILWARRKLVVWTFLLTVATVTTISLLLPKQYTASTSVVIDVKSPDPIAGIVLPGMMAPGYMATQVDIINSDRVAQRVVKLLKMDEIPSVIEDWQEATEGRGTIHSWLGDLLQKKLDVKPSRESNVINISFTGTNSAFSAAVANAFAQAYIDTNIELRVEPARQYAQWFDSQIKVQRDRLEKAQRALSDYQQQTGIVATDERLDYETQKLNDLSTQLTVAQSQSADATSKQKTGNSDTLVEVIQNPLINQLKADVVRLESKLKELSGNVGENHPQYQRAQAELAELKKRLSEETAKITSSVTTAGRVSKAKESEILHAIEAQKTKVLELKKQRDEISVLMREVDTAQRAFEAVGARMTQSKLESQSIQTNVSVLTAAIEPLDPSKPRLILNIAISIVLGGLIGCGLALVLELLQRRIRSTDDLVLALDLPVLAEIDSTDQQQSGRGLMRFLRRKKHRTEPAVVPVNA